MLKEILNEVNKSKFLYVDTEYLLDSGVKYNKIKSGVLPGKFDITVIKNTSGLVGFESDSLELSFTNVYDALKKIKNSRI